MSRQIARVRHIVAALGEGTTTAAILAEQLRVSERTIYRDVERMRAAGSPIEGEAGVGFMLRRPRIERGSDA